MSDITQGEAMMRAVEALEAIAAALEARQVEALDDHELQRQVVEGKREMNRRLRRSANPSER